MAIGISPTVDFAFKLMLGSPEHSGVTIHFLNSILIDQPKITQVEILNPFLGKETEDDKLSILDILATDEHGRLLNIEMQTSLPAGMSQRLAYYVSNVYVSQLYKGHQYTELRPEPWAYFLRNAEKLTPEEIRRLFPDEEIAEAAGVLEMISQSPEQLMMYNARLKFQRDEEARLIQARLEGEARGEARGRQEGRQEGVIVGRVLLLQQLLGIRPSTVDDLSGYDVAQLTELEAELQRQLRDRSQ